MQDKNASPLSKSTVIITGGASGIGRSIAERVIEAGATAVIWDLDENALLGCKEAYGERAITRTINISDPRQIAEAFLELRDAGRMATHLVNNAGIIGRRATISAIEPTDVDIVMATNFRSLVCCTRHFLEYREAGQPSSIVNLTSIAARTGGMPGNSVYAASKGAISSFTIASAKELAPEVRVNAIAPGMIDTAIQADVFASSSAALSMSEFVPMRRLGAPREIAAAAVWLLSADSSYITGTILDVDGGVSVPLWSPAWRAPRP